jgi:hypothetical protein
MTPITKYRVMSPDRKSEFFYKGYKLRYFFPHNIYYLPKCGPDGLKMSRRMSGVSDPNKSWEIILYAYSPLVDEFPEELFFDNDLIWHQQQFGKIGQIATANLVFDGEKLFGMNYISDLVQRISRRRDYKTRIENRFKGWPYMLLNSIVNFAVENNIKKIYSPTADLAIENTDSLRNVQKELFERVYDRAVRKHFEIMKKGKWWEIDVAKNREKLVIPEKRQEILVNGKTICLCHDIERGVGHEGIDASLVDLANKMAPQSLDEMLTIEKELNVKATYNVLGCFFDEVKSKIKADGHCLAFHSYDHKIYNVRAYQRVYDKIVDIIRRNITKKPDRKFRGQLVKCRQVDYRIKGYRPPRSRITPELSDMSLCYRNFEWLASSKNSLGIKRPQMENRIVKIPILFDDFKMYKLGVKYEEWEKEAIDTIRENDFVAFCLHDCYATFWLPHYRGFLKKIRGLGTFKTLNEVADEVIFSNSR